MYPFELSGGLRQRAMIAMALICRPALLIADEPTTALDVTIQAQILKLLRDLQQRFEMAMLLITHDLGVVANVADEVVVIYHGEIMEAGHRAGHLPPPAAPLSQGADGGGAAFRHEAGRAARVAARHLRVDANMLFGPRKRDAKQSVSSAAACGARICRNPSRPARRAGSAAGGPPPSRRSTMSASTSSAANAWGWSAKAAAARRRCRSS